MKATAVSLGSPMAAITGCHPIDQRFEEMGDLAEPEQHRGQDEQRQDLHEIPLHPGIGLGQKTLESWGSRMGGISM